MSGGGRLHVYEAQLGEGGCLKSGKMLYSGRPLGPTHLHHARNWGDSVCVGGGIH